jgi:hypothetical protein
LSKVSDLVALVKFHGAARMRAEIFKLYSIAQVLAATV